MRGIAGALAAALDRACLRLDRRLQRRTRCLRHVPDLAPDALFYLGDGRRRSRLSGFGGYAAKPRKKVPAQSAQRPASAARAQAPAGASQASSARAPSANQTASAGAIGSR